MSDHPLSPTGVDLNSPAGDAPDRAVHDAAAESPSIPPRPEKFGYIVDDQGKRRWNKESLAYFRAMSKLHGRKFGPSKSERDAAEKQLRKVKPPKKQPDHLSPEIALSKAAEAVDPQQHRRRLARLYDKTMRVYERGLQSKDEKTRIKCADVVRGMIFGGIGPGKPTEDVRNNELMIMAPLPDVEQGPTMGELKQAEEEQYFDEEESYDRPFNEEEMFDVE